MHSYKDLQLYHGLLICLEFHTYMQIGPPRLMHLSMSSPTTPHAGHIGGNVGICTSGLSNPHPLGGFRINNPQLIDK